MEKHINREASDKTKGFRLQKLRSAIHMLRNMRDENVQFVVTGVEISEDVFVYREKENVKENIFEEDKNYNKETAFTLNSSQVLNTFVSFMDIWLQSRSRSRKDLEFVFYFTNKIGKERFSKEIQDAFKIRPTVPMLNIIRDKNFDHQGFLDVFLHIFKLEYAIQYEKHDSELGFKDLVQDLDQESMKDFLECVTIFSESKDESELNTEILEEIKAHEYFNSALQGKEDLIKCVILEKIDEKQGESSMFKKVITPAEIKNVFLEIQTEKIKFEDPAYEHMIVIEEGITDKRNLKEKLQVVPDYPASKYKLLAIKVTLNKTEQKRMKKEKSILSTKFRIYMKCSEILLDREKESDRKWTIDEIDSVLKTMKEQSIEVMQDVEKDYTYSLKSESFIEGLMLDLFDGCFLSFEGDQ